MSELYGPEHRALHDRFETRRLADGVEQVSMHQELAEMDKKFITACDMFFLSTIDPLGWPTVSYKGGAPGTVKVVDDHHLVFPCYDGNGTFYSMGNIARNEKVGLLFIDFETPRRLRVHGTATVSEDDPLLAEYHEAVLLVRIKVRNIFTNCARYIHKYRRQGSSKYLPRVGADTPTPDWKRVDQFQPLLSSHDRDAAEQAGLITAEEYRTTFWDGLD